jgi:glutamate formiminotransferase
MIPVLEAVPNISEGKDPEKVRRLVELVEAVGVDVLDWSSDADHHRSVLTFIGDPPAVEEAAFAVARFAVEHIDLRHHRGIHPRVGALDVLPFVPVHDLTMADATEAAHRVGRRIAAELNVPVHFYAQASDPPGRGLADLRRGGVEALWSGFPPGRLPDLWPGGRVVRGEERGLPPAKLTPHATAGVTCVGARSVLLAWNVYVSGLGLDEARSLAGAIRERGGGFPSLRALGLKLPRADRLQISMNLEDPVGTPPGDVLEAIRRRVEALGGAVEAVEVIGMMPDTLVLPPWAGRLVVPDLGSARVLSNRVSEHVERRRGGSTETSDGTG